MLQYLLLHCLMLYYINTALFYAAILMLDYFNVALFLCFTNSCLVRAVNLKDIYDTSEPGGNLEFGTDVSRFVAKQKFEGDTLESQHFFGKNTIFTKIVQIRY